MDVSNIWTSGSILARTWLEHLEEGTIKGWYDLEKEFISHFKGTYNKPGSAWEHAACQCQHEKNETLHDYIASPDGRTNSIKSLRTTYGPRFHAFMGMVNVYAFTYSSYGKLG